MSFITELLQRFTITDAKSGKGLGTKYPKIIRWGTLILFIIILILALLV